MIATALKVKCNRIDWKIGELIAASKMSSFKKLLLVNYIVTFKSFQL